MTDERTPLTDADVGAPVLDTDDTQVGTVDAVEGDLVYVRPEPTVDDARGRGTLGWDDPDARYPVEAAAVERVEAAPGPTFRVDLGELRGGEAADDHLATGGPEPDEPEQREE